MSYWTIQSAKYAENYRVVIRDESDNILVDEEITTIGGKRDAERQALNLTSYSGTMYMNTKRIK